MSGVAPPVAPPPAYVVQQPQPTVQPSVVLGAINPPPTDALQKRERRWAKALKVTGWLQVSLGIVTVIFGIVAIIIRAWFSYYATPIWMGLLFFVTTGILGVLASSRKKKGLIVGYMVMCILTSCVASTLVIFGIIMAAAENMEMYWYNGIHGYYTNICNPGSYEDIIYNCAHKIAGRQVLDSLMTLAAFVEGVVTIVGASYCCYALSCCAACCSQTPTTTTAYYTTTGQVTYPSGPTSGHVYVQVPQATYVVAQGPGNPASKPGVPMYVAQPAPPGGYGQAPLTGYAQAPPTGYPQAQGPVPQQYGVNVAQVPTGTPPPNVQYAPPTGPVQGSVDAPPMYQQQQQQPTAPLDVAYGTK